MRLPNGYGSITKLTGARRKPYLARTAAIDVYDPIKKEYVQKRITIGCYAKKSEALEALAQYNKHPFAIMDANMTMGQIWEVVKADYTASDHRQKVYDSLFNRYLSPISKMKVRDVKARHLQHVFDECKKSSSTKNNIRTVLNMIYRYAMQNDLIDKNYAEFVEYEQEATAIEREIYTAEEVKELWKHKDVEKYALTLILLYQGMRIKEFMDLTKDDVDLVKKTIVIKNAKNAYSVRTIPINTHVIELVKMFYDLPGDKMIRFHVSKYHAFCNNTLGHRAYDARHTFATKCNQLGIKKLVIQRLMGHKPESILEQVYTHLTLEELSENLDKVDYVQ